MILRIIPERAAEIAARCEVAVEGPWTVAGDCAERPPMVWDRSGDSIVNRLPDGRPYFEPSDATFIAAARTDIPDLLADRAALLAENERLRVVIAGLPHAPGKEDGE